MGEWLIYGSNGSQKATVKKLEYSGEFMGETSVTCDVYSPSPISFSIGDYLVYRGERFSIDYDATRLKQARSNTYGKGYTYENMRFLSYVGELKKCEFLDFVPSDNLIPFSQSPQFSFFAEDVSDLADRLQANLDRIYTGNKAWTVQVVSGFDGKTNIEVSVSNINIFDGLKIAYDQFEATYIIRGRTITIGTAGNELETDFKYGKGNGLKTIERSVSESDTLVTRLRAYGNTTNMPPNYYKNLGMQVYLPIREVSHISQTGCDIHFNKITTKCFLDPTSGERTNFWVSVSLDKSLWLKAVVSPNQSNSSVDFSVVSVMLYDGNTQAMLTQFLSQLQSGSYDDLYFSGAINHGAWPIEYREYEEDMPDLMSIDRLMLPGFPSLTTDPYIDASNIGTLGIREKSVFFDGSDPDTPDIHPTLEGMTAAELRAAGYTIDLDAGDNGNLDEIAADATELDGSPITADGSFEDVDEVPGFKVTIKDIGFNIKDYLSQDTATLVIKSGMCGAREFTIVDVQKVGNKYVLECQRTEDSSINKFYPYNPYLIKADDKFVLTNLEMPDAYVAAASQRLLTAAQAYIAKYSAPQYVYAIKMDDIWMQRQRDNSVSETASYYWNIKEGDVMNVQDTDLGIDISEVIDRLNIREGFGPIPEFEVVLRKEKPQGTIGVLQNRIRQLELRNAEQVSTIYRQQNYIDLIIGDKLNTIQEQLDHVQVTYFGEVVPSTSNYPASSWNTDALKEQHVFDMYYDKVHDKGYEWKKVNNTYQWVEITDPNTLEALRIASNEQDTIDGKRRIFVTPAGTLPTPPYDENDLWVNATYPSNSTETNTEGNNPLTYTYLDDILKCVVPKGSTDSASIGDWRLASKYTDDSSLTAFINTTYTPFVSDIQTQVDKKAETWRQSTDPSTAQGWVASEHVGDIWMDTSANGGKNTYIYQNTGTSANPNYEWVAQDVPDAVFDEIDGKAEIFVQKPTTYNERDMWIIESGLSSSDMPAGCQAGDIVISSNSRTNAYTKGDWTKKDRYTDDSAYNAFISYVIQGTGTSPNDAASALYAIKHALKEGNTTTEGGLILSNLLSLGTGDPTASTFVPWAGISGVYNTSETGTGYKGHGIAAWFGGSMVDGEVSQSATNAAKSLFRFDGSGYVAGGNLSWDKNGNVTIQGYSINATTLQVGGSNVATESSISTFFANFFDIYNGSTQITYAQYIALQDKSNVSIKAKYGLWTEQFLSALGLNSSGGGGGGGTVTGISLGGGSAILPDSSTGIVAIPAASSSAYGVIKVGSTLAISSGTLNLKTISGLNTTNYYTKYKVDSYGRVTTQSSLAASDIPDLSATYLPLSGGTMTGLINFDSTDAKIGITTTGRDNIDVGWDWDNRAGAGLALRKVGASSKPANFILWARNASNSYTLEGNPVNGALTWGGNRILDAGNTYVTSGKGYINGTEITTISGNAETATTLATSRTIWGQSFNGSANISGNMTSVGNVTPSANSNNLGTSSARFNIYGTAGNFSSDVSVGGALYLPNANNINFKNASGTYRSVVGYSSSNHAMIGAGTTSDNSSTIIYGGASVIFRLGGTAASNNALVIDSNKVSTFSGKIVTSANAYNYTTDATSYGLNMSNSDLVGVNGIFSSDTQESWTEGINFKRTNSNWDSLRVKDGLFYFSSNNSSSAAGLESVQIVPAAASSDIAVKLVGSSYTMSLMIGSGNTNRGIYDHTNSKWAIYFNASNTILNYGNIAIGNTSPSQKLHVTGNILASGEVTASSDERLKNIVSETKFDVKDIASARSILFEWKDKSDKRKLVHGGSIAQDWLGKADSFLSQDNDGFYSINYGALALCSAITIAKEVVKHEDEITRLKKEVVKLRERVAELEERRIA